MMTNTEVFKKRQQWQERVGAGRRGVKPYAAATGFEVACDEYAAVKELQFGSATAGGEKVVGARG